MLVSLDGTQTESLRIKEPGVVTLVLTETVGHRAICQYIPLIDENSLIVAAIDAFGIVALRS